MDNETIRKLRLALTAHADDLQLYANGLNADAETEFELTAARIFALIYRLQKEFQKRGYTLDRETRKFLDSLRAQIGDIRASIYEKMADDFDEQLPELVKEEKKFHSLFFAAAGWTVLANLPKITADRISEYGIYNGETRSQIISRLKADDIQRLYTVISNGLQQKLSLGEILTEVEKKLNTGIRFADWETAVIVNGIANDISMAIAADNGMDMLYSAVMDNNVCPECKELNGKIFTADDPDLPVLPQHVNCRCMLIPVMGSEKEKLAPVSFAEYLKSMPEEEQRMRLGNEKYELWKQGEYTLKKYEPPTFGQKISLAELNLRTDRLFS